MATKSVLFVCLGNICRSTMAEAIFEDMVTKKGVRGEWLIDSAATGSHTVGDSCYPSTQVQLKKNGINYKHKARQITKEDFNKFDYILAFDKENIANIERFRSNSKGKAEVRLLGFYHPKKQNYIIEDPWWNDTPAVFENCYNECYVCCESFLKSIYKD